MEAIQQVAPQVIATIDPMAVHPLIEEENPMEQLVDEAQLQWPYACYQLVLALVLALLFAVCYYLFPTQFDGFSGWYFAECGQDADFVALAEQIKQVVITLVMAS